ncbi:hypothetical protein [Stutzerimonas stutzeri]|uniref:hypothetical protein n=1 Tax=Stutzerimonas stutzeri TaxID=316 RepID=UPI00210BE672|nr:hypothetical protein [Stutzerimonas stutzeri]MCQ4257461.1 hypothetical protein [Stutzerimonas stutzeri]
MELVLKLLGALGAVAMIIDVAMRHTNAEQRKLLVGWVKGVVGPTLYVLFTLFAIAVCAISIWQIQAFYVSPDPITRKEVVMLFVYIIDAIFYGAIVPGLILAPFSKAKPKLDSDGSAAA